MCAIDDGDGGYVVSSSQMRKARKVRVCGECARAIAIGEQYECASGLYDGRWDRHYTCAHCVAARSWLLVECNGWLYRGVLEELGEHWGYGELYRSPWLEQAIAGMRAHWRTQDGPLMPPLEPYRRGVEAA